MPVYTEQKLAWALRMSGGRPAAAARLLGCHRATVLRYVQKERARADAEYACWAGVRAELQAELAARGGEGEG